ncbi:hypothetical protein B0H16DRAFT_1693080 [Mycena metata]|uniref:Uncharacterized protein n=1 Tax=Mycena metata TaxID=1033252 RepID=A0AAD7IMI1_9AGAR|nr:hypothetical protein B0H16DRAFT_1693080 [Mycena metata]
MSVRRGTALPISEPSVLDRRRSRGSYAMRAPPAKAEPAASRRRGGGGGGRGGGLGPSSWFGLVEADEAGARRRDSPADDIHGEDGVRTTHQCGLVPTAICKSSKYSYRLKSGAILPWACLLGALPPLGSFALNSLRDCRCRGPTQSKHLHQDGRNLKMCSRWRWTLKKSLECIALVDWYSLHLPVALHLGIAAWFGPSANIRIAPVTPGAL